MKACDMREKAAEELQRMGWCWGPNDAIGADKHWIKCSTEMSYEFTRIEDLDYICKGNAEGFKENIDEACHVRDEKIKEANQKGWCWINPSAAEVEKQWGRCQH